MKNKLILASSILLFGLASCSKDRTCECNITTSGSYTDSRGVNYPNETRTSTTITKYKKVSKSDIEVTCGNGTQTLTNSNSNGSSSVSINETKCTIK